MTDLLTLAWTFVRLSFLCVGGGLGVVPEMQRQVVGIHGWLTARQFVDGYALAQVTPGPGMLVSAFIGYRVYGLLGAFVAMTAMFLPTSLLTWFVARHWQRLQGRPWALAVERGLAPLAIGLMAAGVYTVGRSALTDLPTTLLAVAACITLAKRWLPAAGVVLAAGIVSYLLGALIP
ncbi:MAG TPA: chromate transporter [Candidatus Methylomirabilis sp.]